MPKPSPNPAPPEKPRWLTLEELCAELRLPPLTVWKLVRMNKIVGLKTGNRMHARNWRFLDPSPEYKKALHAQESLMRTAHSIDLMQFPVISPAEFAELTGLTQSTLRNHVESGTLQPHRIGRFSVYTAQQVRDFLLKRERREPTDRRARCGQLLAWCREQLEKNPQSTLTRAEVEADDRLEGTLRRILRQRDPDRSRHLAEFWRRWELAKTAAQLTVNGTK